MRNSPQPVSITAFDWRYTGVAGRMSAFGRITLSSGCAALLLR